MMFGLGAIGVTVSTTTGTAGATTSAPPSFSQGISLWSSPSNALSVASTLLQQPSAAFSSQVAPFSLGVLLPPLAAVGLLIYAMSGGKK